MIKRDYTQEQVERLRGTIRIDHTWSRLSAERFRKLLVEEKYIPALGAMTGNQAIQQVQAGLNAIYASGWQVAADANDACEMYPDQSLYPANSMPILVNRIQKALQRADQIQHLEGSGDINYLVPIIADAEAGFGGPLNAFELTKALIEAGAAAIHLEDQLSSAKKCGHLGGKVLVSNGEYLRKLSATRLAADVCDVPLVIIARTDANNARLIQAAIDSVDLRHIDDLQMRTVEGFYHFNGGIQAAIDRSLTYAPYADILWCETATPSLHEAEAFASAIHDKFPGKWLAYNCSPSFNWGKHLELDEMANFQKRLGEFGYKFQFVTLAGFHSLNQSMFTLASQYKETGMLAYNELQQREHDEVSNGYTALMHQKFVGVSYFDTVAEIVTGHGISTKALEGSTEGEQF